ncbi:hypothetical protein B0J15DRAFT_409228 [Fusarium solani]|uniref:GRF-like zinc ribbon domain-containing protein n=1 Tax=Fusarium solani TaxID=169388 RepID=A0A9P9G4T0_FUSSL|nr:uncharacterized protein B0J15DRAFT_409228 [Fusarium solani]KAH7232501.1 hypothetical protein B0J15DRAFT_409228 [Fusarium solani]
MRRKTISFDISTASAVVLGLPPNNPPNCFICQQRSVRFKTRTSNRKGNAGRPYYKCVHCRKFLAFADQRGNDPQNPPCHCALSSKRQAAGQEKGSGLHYVCRNGTCDFYAPCLDNGGNQVSVDGDLRRMLASLQII